MSRRRVNPIFPVPSTCASPPLCVPLSLSIFSRPSSQPPVSGLRLSKTSPRLTTGGSRYTRTGFHIRKVLGFWPKEGPLIPAGGSPLKATLLASGPGLLLNQPPKLHPSASFNTVFWQQGTPQNFADGFRAFARCIHPLISFTRCSFSYSSYKHDCSLNFLWRCQLRSYE